MSLVKIFDTPTMFLDKDTNPNSTPSHQFNFNLKLSW